MTDDRLERAEELLGRVEAARAELERISGGGDADALIDVLAKLAELAREVDGEIVRVKREADAEAG